MGTDVINSPVAPRPDWFQESESKIASAAHRRASLGPLGDDVGKIMSDFRTGARLKHCAKTLLSLDALGEEPETECSKEKSPVRRSITVPRLQMDQIEEELPTNQPIELLAT